MLFSSSLLRWTWTSEFSQRASAHQFGPGTARWSSTDQYFLRSQLGNIVHKQNSVPQAPQRNLMRRQQVQEETSLAPLVTHPRDLSHKLRLQSTRFQGSTTTFGSRMGHSGNFKRQSSAPPSLNSAPDPTQTTADTSPVPTSQEGSGADYPTRRGPSYSPTAPSPSSASNPNYGVRDIRTNGTVLGIAAGFLVAIIILGTMSIWWVARKERALAARQRAFEREQHIEPTTMERLRRNKRKESSGRLGGGGGLFELPAVATPVEMDAGGPVEELPGDAPRRDLGD